MKNISIYILFIVVSLSARENPFEQDSNITKLNRQVIMIEDVNNSIFDKFNTMNDKHKIENKSIKYDDKFVSVLYRVLPFVKIDVRYESLKIISRPKYKIIQYITLKDENKIAFDFFASDVTMAYTRYKKLNAPYFKSYVVGLHKKDKYFRVTIVLKHQFEKYDISIKNNMATIRYYK